MPATEQTWRDSKLLHVVFGLSGLAMLLATIWMLASDHRREWKDYQRKFQSIEAWTAKSRLTQQETDKYRAEVDEARAAYETARRELPDEALFAEFYDAVKADAEANKEEPRVQEIDSAYRALAKADPENKPAARDHLRDALSACIARAKFREDTTASLKKFMAADLDVARSQYELGVGNALPAAELKSLQQAVDFQRERVDAETLKVQETKSYRERLEGLLNQMTATELAAKKKLDDLVGQRTQLEKALYDRETHVMTEVAELPILDAFGRPIEIKQIWLPKLTINNNFSDVARFDRCTSCHLAMDKTAPGSAIKPGYPPLEVTVLEMQTPAEAPAALQEKPDASLTTAEQRYDAVLQEVYGLQLAPQGIVHEQDAVVAVIRPETAAAKAQLEVGDVIASINDVKMLDKRMAYNYLLESVAWGKPLKLTVHRGLPQPFSSHPRLDLFVGSLSPHKMADIGCTICHDGQGSATAFKWASHSPNDPLEGNRWKREHGWFDNHHWIYPMYPKRFAESLCLKCHHQVTELEPSERFPEPPAPKLVEGFHLIQEVGCFGCHEINGYDGPNRRIGPDLRAEPNYSAAAAALLAGGGLSEQQAEWATTLARQPSDDSARHSLAESLKSGEKLPGVPQVTKKLVTLLDDVETPGKLRKVGPSLRHVASKVDFDFLYSWVRKPSDFRPSTKMPQFFGLFDHLDEHSLAISEKFEPIEIRGAVEYLLKKSQPFAYAEPPKSGVAEASSERGKLAFEIRCLACHQHSDFPAGTMTQGPDLSRIGAKLDNSKGKQWLYTWLRNPSTYHARTLMPNMILDPVKDEAGKTTDPAADIAAFLLGSKQGWEAKDVPGQELSAAERTALDELAFENLKAVTSSRKAKEYLENGIPEDRRDDFKGDEVELIGPMSPAKKLQYVGRRTISKYGCSGCHDIPGFEDAKPIGTGLADWARKTSDKLAFEQIVEYLKKGHGHPGPLKYDAGEHGDVTDKQIEEAEVDDHGHEEFNFLNMDPSEGYFMEKLVGHQREGFIWQKLRQPRSYDYEKTQNKSYNERLRMPQFTVLDDQQREAIITFVLGLVAEPPAQQYVYKPNPRRDAIVQGLQVIDKFNCTGCHTLQLDRWQLAYNPSDFPELPKKTEPVYPFLQPHFTPQQIQASLAVDARGLRHASVSGTATVDANGQPVRVDEEGSPIDPADSSPDTKAFYTVVPWENILINGEVREAGLDKLQVPETAIEKHFPPFGGFLSRLAYPVVVEEGKKANSNLNVDEVWGWLPPPLVGEGKKVQSEWLHSFLLDPHAIRPAAVLRMPKFNMSPDEATKLVNYFAAVDGADYPYNFDPRTRESYLAAEEKRHPGRLGDALNIVVDNSFCVQCHIVGDFVPKAAKGPALNDVYKRLRPEYVLDWIASPKRILPYTGMPDNIKPDKPVSQTLFKGTSEEQLNALVDFLLNYDRFMESKTSIKPLVKPAAETPAAQAQDAAQ